MLTVPLAALSLQVWPFKDPAYDLKRLTMDRPAQAVPVLQEAAVQVCQQAGGALALHTL